MKKNSFVRTLLILLSLFVIFGTLLSFSASAETTGASIASSDATAQQQSLGSSIKSFVIMLAAIGLMGYFLIFRPEKKRKKEAKEMSDGLAVGDKITTIGGIVGTVAKITDTTITLKNGLLLQRWALRSIDEKGDAPKEAVVESEDDEDDEKDAQA